MEEEKIGVIPHVSVMGAWGVKEYGILLTNQRSILVLLKYAKTTGAALLGGAIGGALASSMAEEKQVDWDNSPPQSLAAEKDSISVPFEGLESFRFKKSLGSYKILMKYNDPRGKKKKLDVVVVPRPEYIKQKKEEGLKAKQALEQYALSVQEAFYKVLPPSVAHQAGRF